MRNAIIYSQRTGETYCESVQIHRIGQIMIRLISEIAVVNIMLFRGFCCKNWTIVQVVNRGR